MLFLAIFGFYTLLSFQRYQERLKRSSDEKVMRETKLEVKKWGPSEKFSLTSEISLAASEISRFRLTCENLDMSNKMVLNFLNFFEISLRFLLKQKCSLNHCS